MYFQNYTPPQTHLAPAETNPAFGAYELQGVGADQQAKTGPLQMVAGVANYASPFFFGYYGYQKDKSWGTAAMYFFGSAVLQIPATLIGVLAGAVVGGIPGGSVGSMIFPAVGAYYAFGKKG